MNEEIKSMQYFKDQIKAQFASQVITAMSETMKFTGSVTEALGEISRDEAVASIIDKFSEEMEKVK